MRFEGVSKCLAVALALGATLVPAVAAFGETSVELEGALRATKDESGNVSTATLTVCEGTRDIEYSVVLDETGRKLAGQLDKMEVSVRGTSADRDGKLCVTVREYALVILGAVSADTGDDGTLSAVRIQVRDGGGRYAVVLDDAGKKLAASFKGKDVQVTGEYRVENGVKTLAVKSVAALETRKGFLEVQEDEDGNLLGARIVEAGEGDGPSHPVLLDANGKKLASAMAWETVEVAGVFRSVNGKTWMKVHEFRRIEPPPEEEDEGPGEEEEEE